MDDQDENILMMGYGWQLVSRAHVVKPPMFKVRNCEVGPLIRTVVMLRFFG